MIILIVCVAIYNIYKRAYKRMRQVVCLFCSQFYVRGYSIPPVLPNRASILILKFSF